MVTSTIDINTVCGEIAREVASIDNIDTLTQIQRYIAKLLSKQKKATYGSLSKQEVLDDFRCACKEIKMHEDGKGSLLTFDDVLESL